MTPEQIAEATLAEDAEVLAAARQRANDAYSQRIYEQDKAIRTAFLAGDSRTYERLIASRRRAHAETANPYNPARPGEP